MAFNIKDEATVERARRIAARTGETMSEAIATAVAERDQRLSDDRDERRARVMKLIERCGERLAGRPPIDHDALLYDPKTGLPR
jgi:antitoxin VapB